MRILIVTDAWSGGIYFRELTTLYQAFTRGGDSPLPEHANLVLPIER